MHKVIFDADPGVDDAMALLFLHNHPEIDLVGITTVFGNAPIELTTRNALYLKREWKIPAPVAKGAGQTFYVSRVTHSYPVWIHGDDGLGNIGVPDVSDEVPLDPRPAHHFIIDMLKAHPGEITLVAVGRMTNLANALREAPEIVDLVKEVVIMGGAVDVPGNITPAAEANFHGDPEAADMVMTARWKVVLVGLDATLMTTMSRKHMRELAHRGGPRVQLLANISEFYIDFYNDHVADSMVVHDSCACLYVVAPELFTTRSGPVRVLTTGIGEGMAVQKPDGMNFGKSVWDDVPSQRVCTHVDAEKLMALLSDTLVGL